jgi:MFS family permease
MSTPFYLFKSVRFAPLFTVQFLGAFNDNIFKNTLAVMVTFQAAQWSTLNASLLAPLIGVIFILPFFLFSGFSGALADKYDKAMLTRWVKGLEFVLMGLATMGFAFHWFGGLLMVVFGLGIHSTLFGPIKYAIIPQHLGENELVTANALIEAGTFTAILLGTLGGGVLSLYPNGGVIAGVMGMTLALMGYGASRFIPSAPSLEPHAPLSWNLLTQTLTTLTLSCQNKSVFGAIVGISWFWLVGALLLSSFPALVKTLLHGDETTVTMVLSLFTIGIGVGSFACERLSHHTIRLSLVVIGAVGMGIAGIDFALTAHHFHAVGILEHNPAFIHILGDLTAMGIFGGLYSVPLYALMQNRSDPKVRSRIIASNNILNALFMVLGSVMMMGLVSRGWEISEVLLLVSCLTMGIAFVIGTIYYREK